MNLCRQANEQNTFKIPRSCEISPQQTVLNHSSELIYRVLEFTFNDWYSFLQVSTVSKSFLDCASKISRATCLNDNDTQLFGGLDSANTRVEVTLDEGARAFMTSKILEKIVVPNENKQNLCRVVEAMDAFFNLTRVLSPTQRKSLLEKVSRWTLRHKLCFTGYYIRTQDFPEGGHSRVILQARGNTQEVLMLNAVATKKAGVVIEESGFIFDDSFGVGKQLRKQNPFDFTFPTNFGMPNIAIGQQIRRENPFDFPFRSTFPNMF